MKRERTGDDKFLALLVRMPGPLSISEVCEELSWTRQRGQQVADRLVRDKKVVRVESRKDGTTGRPSHAFVLPAALPVAGAPALTQLEPHTYVLTPSGEEARIIGMRGRSYAEYEYVTGPERFQRGKLHVTLLRPFQPGRARPAPARVELKVKT